MHPLPFRARPISRAAIAFVLATGLAVGLLPGSAVAADSRFLAPGFVELPPGAKVVVMPVDVQLSSISAGGVVEPKADWTQAAREYMAVALKGRASQLGPATQLMQEAQAEEFDELVGLQAAVARSISLHHVIGMAWSLPTKQGRLDWSLDDSMKPLAARTGANYGLFVWVRDSYATAERKLAMVGMALLGVGITGGVQVGYASLVDLGTGRVVWFNRLARTHGDLREPKSAAESIDALLTGLPVIP